MAVRSALGLMVPCALPFSQANLAKKLKLAQPSVQKSLDHLADLGIVREITGKRRSRIYE